MERYIYLKRETIATPCVLFQDYNQYWAPLDDLFFSTSSKVLVSRHPDSAVEDIVSHYCPQCLKKYSEDEVHKNANRCTSCMQCPCCSSLLAGDVTSAAGMDEGNCYFRCCHCKWTSLGVGITGKDESDLSLVVLERENNNKSSEAFSAVLSSLSSVSHVETASSTMSLKNELNWNIKALEECQERKNTESMCRDPQTESLLFKHMNKGEGLGAEDVREMCYILSCNDSSDLSTFEQRWQGECTNTIPSSLSTSLPPQRSYLRTKKMLRCRKDVKAGKMSILVQPNTFPLEGDSSHKLRQGQWFLKDASACHHIPRIIITKLPTFSSEWNSDKLLDFIHIEVLNSKTVDVKVTITSAFMIRKDDQRDDISCEERRTMDTHSQLATSEVEKHPPFVFNGVHQILQVEGSSEEDIILKAYEDELLRDDSEHSVPEFAEEEWSGNYWNAVVNDHVAKMCVPVSLIDVDTTRNDSLNPYYDVMFMMKVADVENCDTRTPDNSECSNVLFRVVFRL